MPTDYDRRRNVPMGPLLPVVQVEKILPIGFGYGGMRRQSSWQAVSDDRTDGRQADFRAKCIEAIPNNSGQIILDGTFPVI
ncbi:hypothetical protein X729_02095 [Mesorhizobium sp. L103C131B0]|nr:hypothetical protein X729_02095 [Mesorhizobium sp. L103C131B0]